MTFPPACGGPLKIMPDTEILQMKYYGLHFTGDDKEPLQVRVSMENQQIWCRSCINGEWTAWRRLDVERNAEGEIDEKIANLKALTAERLANPFVLRITGQGSGSARIDGALDTDLGLEIPALEDIFKRLGALEEEVVELEKTIKRYHEWGPVVG